MKRHSQSPSHRTRRAAEVVRQVVASFLTGEARDPRIGLVTVTRVEITGDLTRAVVHYVVHGDAAVQKTTAEGLVHAAPAVRSAVGRELSLRVVPEIVFQADAGHEHASRIEELLAKIKCETPPGGSEGTPS